MAYTQAEIQAQAREISGLALQYNEDLHAAMDFIGITPDRQLNERLMELTGGTTASAAWNLLLTNGFDPYTPDLLLVAVGSLLKTSSTGFLRVR